MRAFARAEKDDQKHDDFFNSEALSMGLAKQGNKMASEGAKVDTKQRRITRMQSGGGSAREKKEKKGLSNSTGILEEEEEEEA